ncbi:MAG: LysM peptidoglycan-binding domain-containing protein [Aquificae bacterium]|nr:LysM peptidoglycan-binding domain-containing protein [Aquificota bacterium]
MSLFTVLILGISALLFSAECHIYYTVKRGDSLWAIARKFNLSVKELYRLNPRLKRQKYLRPGQRICVAYKPVKKRKKSATRYAYKTSYVTYRVKRGDTLAKIARRFGTTVKAIKRANRLRSDRIYVGQKLRIPVKKKVAVKREERKRTRSRYVKVRVRKTVYITYRVKRGDTLIKIARKFGTTVKAIKRANRLRSDRIYVGQRLRIPVTRVVYERRPLRAPKPKIDFFPVKGRVVRNKRGVLIYAGCGRPVKAVEDGTVVYSGDDLSAFGNVIIVDHGSFVSLYAYAARSFVRVGQRVRKGQEIARVGIKPDEGRCALHFEVRSPEGSLLNPLEYVRSK